MALKHTVLGRPFQATVRPMPRDCCPVCNIGVLWPNGWMDQHATWYEGRPRTRQHCVRWTPSSPTERGTHLPHFSAHVYFGPCLLWPNGRPSQQLLSSCWARGMEQTHRPTDGHQLRLSPHLVAGE